MPSKKIDKNTKITGADRANINAKLARLGIKKRVGQGKGWKAEMRAAAKEVHPVDVSDELLDRFKNKTKR